MTERRKSIISMSGIAACALCAGLVVSDQTVRAGSKPKSGANSASTQLETFRPLVSGKAVFSSGEEVALRVNLDQNALSSLAGAARPAGAASEPIRKVLVPFPISEDESLPLELERFSATSSSTRVVIAKPGGVREIAPPQIAMFRGRVEGQPNSLAYLAFRGDGHGNGFVILDGGEKYYLSSGTADNDLLAPGEFVITQNADPRFTALPEGVEFCGFDGSGHTPAAPLAAAPALDNRGVRLAQVAVDGDQMYVGLFGGDETAAASYIIELLGGVSVIYERDVDVRLNVSFIRLWPVGGEPFQADNLGGFRNHWLNNEDTTGLNYVHLFSGRRNLPFGGIGFFDAGCSSGAYAISGYLNGAFVSPAENFSLNNWDQTVVAHEMGHNSGTAHTHDGFFPTIDDCGNGVPSRGTIMSYCHIHTGYMTSIDLRFHRRVQEVMQNEIAAAGCMLFDCNGNGIDDALDITNLSSPDLNANGVPDECEDCNGNGVLDNMDIAGPVSADVNFNGIPDECEADCNGNSVPDEFEIANQTTPDLNGNNIPDNCEADCDLSGTPDFLEIVAEPNSDLDRNNVPDACQDCNGNTVSDWIDLQRQSNLLVGDQAGLVREYHQRSGWPVTQYNSGGSFTPFDVAVGADRALYVANFSGGEIVRFPLMSPGPITKFVPPGGALALPSALLFEPSGGALLVADQSDNSVKRFDGVTGADLGVFVPSGSGGLVNPFGMLIGPNGNLFVTSSDNRVLEYNISGGGFIGEFVSAGSGGLNSPRGLAFMPSTGNLVVASHANSVLLEYDGATGAFLKVFSDDLSIASPWGLKVGPNGNLFAARGGAVPRIIEYVPEGRYHRYYVRNEIDMVTPTGLAFMPQSEFDVDGNGILDACEAPPGCCDMAGDANGNGNVNIGDVTFLITRLFGAGAAPPCFDEADANGDGSVNVADVTFLIARIFGGGPPSICGSTGT
ncbi:MAG: M12 family metallo-peptidase [Candidatus Zixiibacteriota bacterium]